MEQSHDNVKRFHLGLGYLSAVNLLFARLHKLAVGLGAARDGKVAAPTIC
jgi:hypothetical protein